MTALLENGITTPALLNVTPVNSTSVTVGSDYFSSFMTIDTYERFSFVCSIIVTPIICTFGMIFNGLGLGVILPDIKQQKMSIYTYLCVLTLNDMVYLALGLIREIPTVMKNCGMENSKFVEENMKRVTVYLDMVFSHMSTAMILMMSFERMFALVRPLHVKNTWLAKYPVRIVCACLLFNIMFLLPFAIYLEVGSYQAGNETEYFLQFNPAVESDMKRYMIAQTVVDYFIPAVCLLITNITIPVKYYKLSRDRLTTFSVSSGNFTNRQLKITSTVFAITFMYFLLSIPNLSIKILGFVDEEYSFDGKYKLVFWFAIDLSNLFTYMNAANDCVIYILVSDYYRKLFKKKYCKCCFREIDYSEENGDVTTRTGNASASTSMVLF